MAKNWAIAIGINKYQNLPPLKYAVRDAELMKNWFENEAGFDKVYLFTDTSPEIKDADKPYNSQPSRGTLRRFLRVRFERPFLSAGDNLWFFFSGHGMRYGNRDYLLPSDVDPHPDELESSAIPLAYVTERLRRCGADNIVLILDACRDKGSSKGLLGVGEEKQQGVITIASCSPAERSYEIEELQQGSFTYSLLQGLRIQGEGNCATVERLYRYLQSQVPEINRIYQKPRQTPYAIAEPASKYHLILLPEYIQPTLEDIARLREYALEAEAENNLKLAETLWNRLVKFDQERSLRALRRIWLKLQGQDRTIVSSKEEVAPISQSGQKTPVVEPQVIRARTDNSRSRTERVVSPRREANRNFPPRINLPTPQIHLSRRRLLQIVGFTGTGIGVAFLATTVPKLISNLDNEQTEPKPKTDIEEKTPVIEPEVTTESNLELLTSNFEVVTVNSKGQEITREKEQAKYYSERLSSDVTLEMIAIPGGKFFMGSPLGKGADDEKPQHEVTIKPFFMGKYPVTQYQWRTVMGNNPAIFQDSLLQPIEQISWYGAIEFCQRLSKTTGKEYRLPSEAEWEYACRAGTTTPFYFGKTITGNLANYDATRITYAKETLGVYRQTTTIVGSFPPNRFGLYDMHGNVWEWCADNWHDNYEGAPTDGTAWITGGDNHSSPLRGGSWFFYSNNCRSTSRLNNVKWGNYIVRDVGFRVVCNSSSRLG
ncbi:MAG: SUMF1/EgtB/PvdO family nonheme iron enzyme [Xenococcus sp. (in: cyanobacteria)]